MQTWGCVPLLDNHSLKAQGLWMQRLQLMQPQHELAKVQQRMATAQAPCCLTC